MNTFTNPYLKDLKIYNGEGKNVIRCVTDTDKDDYEFIQLIRPSKGTIITTANLLWSKLVNFLKANDITDITKRNEFESVVANLVFFDGRGGTPISRNVARNIQRNDSRTTKSLGNGAKVVKNLGASVKSKTGRKTR